MAHKALAVYIKPTELPTERFQVISKTYDWVPQVLLGDKMF